MLPKISFWRAKYILVMFQFEKHLEFTFCRTMWRNIWGPALFLAPARKGADQQNLSKLDSIWKSCTLSYMYMLPFYFIDTLTDTDSTGWVDDTNQIIVVLLVCWLDFISCAKEPRRLTHIELQSTWAKDVRRARIWPGIWNFVTFKTLSLSLVPQRYLFFDLCNIK